MAGSLRVLPSDFIVTSLRQNLVKMVGEHHYAAFMTFDRTVDLDAIVAAKAFMS